MKGILNILLSFSLFAFFSCNKSTINNGEIYSKEYKKEIFESRKDLSLHILSNEVPGMSLAVAVDNEIVWSEGLGLASIELDVPTTPETKFRIGGVTKMFTAAVFAKLAEEGKIDPEKSVRDYLPELPVDKQPIKLIHLAQNTAGFRQPEPQELRYTQFANLQKGISTFTDDTLLFAPGEYCFESDLGYDLLGAAIERATNHPFSKVLSEILTDTLHLKSTVCDDPMLIIPNRSDCFERSIIARPFMASTFDNRQHVSSTGLLSSAADIVLLMNEYLTPKYFKPETIQKIITPVKLNNGTTVGSGMGISLIKDNMGNILYIANGSTVGGSATVFVNPEYKLVIALITNISDEQNGLPILKVAETFLRKIAPERFKSKSEN